MQPTPTARMTASDPYAQIIPLAGLGEHASLASTELDTHPEIHGEPTPAISGGEFAALDALVRQGVLHRTEAALAQAMPPVRRSTFVAGRVALRAALASPRFGALSPGVHEQLLGSTSRGAPLLPSGLTGSVSHKRRHHRQRAIAIAGVASGGLLGVDLESRPLATEAERPSVAARILTPREFEVVRDLDPHAHRDATVLRFSLKEAIYKAIDPIVQRYVRFTEVEVDVNDDGSASVSLLLPELAGSAARVEAWWQRDDEWIITTARLIR